MPAAHVPFLDGHVGTIGQDDLTGIPGQDSTIQVHHVMDGFAVQSVPGIDAMGIPVRKRGTRDEDAIIHKFLLLQGVVHGFEKEDAVADVRVVFVVGKPVVVPVDEYAIDIVRVAGAVG